MFALHIYGGRKCIHVFLNLCKTCLFLSCSSCTLIIIIIIITILLINAVSFTEERPIALTPTIFYVFIELLMCDKLNCRTAVYLRFINFCRCSERAVLHLRYYKFNLLFFHKVRTYQTIE